MYVTVITTFAFRFTTVLLVRLIGAIKMRVTTIFRTDALAVFTHELIFLATIPLFFAVSRLVFSVRAILDTVAPKLQDFKDIHNIQVTYGIQKEQNNKYFSSL